jgi:hypothetical protein
MKTKHFLILLIILSVNSFAQSKNDPVKIQNMKSNFSGMVRLGGSYAKTQDRQGDENYGDKVLIKADVLGRYAISDSFAFDLGIGKWFGSGEVSAEAGSVAYGMQAGVVWGINGSLVNRTKVETRIKKRKITRNGKHYFITNTEKTTIRNDIDGFRLGLHVLQSEFSKLSDPVYGVGGSLYYEKRAGEQSIWQYGIKYDTMTNSRVSAQLAQVFIGFGFLP